MELANKATKLTFALGDAFSVARLGRLIYTGRASLRHRLWRRWGTAVWTHKGLVCSAGAFKDHVKLNFFKGASLKDPSRLFNAGLDAKTTRAIDFSEGDKIDASALKDLIRTAVALNSSTVKEA